MVSKLQGSKSYLEVLILSKVNLVDKARAKLKRSQVKVREGELHCYSHRRSDHIRVENSKKVDATCGLNAHTWSVINDSCAYLCSTIYCTRELGHCGGVAECFNFAQGAFSFQR